MKNQYITIYLHKKKWVKGVSNSLKWDAKLEDGQIIVENSASAVREASTKLLLDHGLPPTQLITFRHVGAQYDSFKPDQLAVFAENGVRNEIKRLKAVQERSESGAHGGKSGFKGFQAPTQPKDLSASVGCLCKTLGDIQELLSSGKFELAA